MLLNAGLLVSLLAEHATAASRRQPGTFVLQRLLDSPLTHKEAIYLAESLMPDVPDSIHDIDLTAYEDFQADFDCLVKLADMLVSFLFCLSICPF